MRALALALVALAAGCAAPGEAPTLPSSAEWGQGPSDPIACGPAAPPLFLVEKHGDHGFGRTRLVAVWDDGRLLVQEGFMRFAEGGSPYWTFRDAVIEAIAPEAACAVALRAPDLAPNSTGRLDVYWIHAGAADPDALASFRQDLRSTFMALPEDAGVRCLSGGDAWAEAHLDGRSHAVQAVCAGTAPFEEVRARAGRLAAHLLPPGSE